MSKTGKVLSGQSSDDTIIVSQKPLRRGHDFFFGGYVHDVFVCRSESSAVYVKSKCWASQKKNTKYTQRLVLSEMPCVEGDDTGDDLVTACAVDFATCEGCPAGADGVLCQHIFALLMTLEHYGPRFASSSLPGPQSVTSQPRQWGVRKRNVAPQPIMSLSIERPRMEESRKGPPIECTLREVRGEEEQFLEQEEIDDLEEMLEDGCPIKMLLPSDTDYVDIRFGTVPTGCFLHQQLQNDAIPAGTGTNDTLGHGSLVHFPALPLRVPLDDNILPEWPIDLAAAQTLEQQTSLQREDAQWRVLHQYTITSSNFKRVLKCKTGQDGLLKLMFDGAPLGNVQAIAHGQQYEQQAISAYKAAKSKDDQPVQVRSCGLVLHLKYKFLGASPDGLVFDEKARPRFGLLEVKCPYTAFIKSLSVEQACTDPSFCCEMVGGKPALRSNHAYFYQMQGQMAITGAKWCDFFVWLGQSWHLERIYADSQLWSDTMLPGLVAYNDHARSYLSSKNRPVPPNGSKQGSLAEVDKFANQRRWETLLAVEQAQSTIDGRNGSNACTIISGLFVHNFLSACGEPDISTGALCTIMANGNDMYDFHNFSGQLLSADEVLQLRPSLGLNILRENFFRYDQLPAFVDALLTESQRSANKRSGAIFVRTPYSFSMCCGGGEFVLFDSHRHRSVKSGALITCLPSENALDYLHYFFTEHYPQLFHSDFTDRSAVAHVTFVAIV